PTGPGIRVDTFGYAGYRTSPRFDSLLAKVIAHTTRSSFAEAVTRCARALSEFRVEGVPTNIPFLQSLLQHPDFRAARLSTRFVEDHLQDLVSAAAAPRERRYVESAPSPNGAQAGGPGRAGARVDATDPLAVLTYGQA